MSYKRPKIISRLKRYTTVNEFIVFDTETMEVPLAGDFIDLSLRLGVLAYVKLSDSGIDDVIEYTTFYRREELLIAIEMYTKEKGELLVFAHNIGFDLRVCNMIHLLAENGYIGKPPIINNRRFIYSVRRDKVRITFCDTSNFGVSSVSELGSSMSLQKLDVDFDNATNLELEVYCKRDVEILVKFISEYIRFIRYNKLGSFKLTVASQALTAYRTRFMQTDIRLHEIPKALWIENRGYHGGRVECFYIGELSNQQLYKLDVNSMYPFVMRNRYIPHVLLSVQGASKISAISFSDDTIYRIADVNISSDRNYYPYYTGQKLIFPIGEYNTVLHEPELKRAILNGDVTRINSVMTYRASQIFTEYVDFFYDIKVKATHDHNPTWRLISKLFQNSLYGKFGQSLYIRIHIGQSFNTMLFRNTGYDAKHDRFFQEIGWFGDIYREYQEGETSFSFKAIAGSVTSYARDYLLSLMLCAGLSNVFYVDTDSLVVNQIGYDNLTKYISADELGYLKLEETSDHMTIYGAKDYIFNEKRVIKGVPKNAKQIAANSWELTYFEGFISWLNNGGVNGMRIKPMIKRRISPYGKGIVCQDTGVVSPFVL